MPLRAGQGEGGGSLNLVHNASDVDDDNDERRRTSFWTSLSLRFLLGTVLTS